MNVGDRFKYQVGTPFESVATIELRNGVEWLKWSDRTSDVPLADFWYAPTDERLSLLLA